MGEENNDKNKEKVTQIKKLPNVAAPGPSHNSSGPSQTPARPMDILYYSFFSDTSSLSATEVEEEIQVIEPDITRPIEFITPMLKQGEVDINNLTRNISTSDRLLIDQKAKLTHLRRSKKRRHAIDFGQIVEVDNEEDDSYESLAYESLERISETPEINDRQNQNQNSEDADISEVDSAL